MKILFFINRYPGYGGIETVTTVLANYFFEEGHEISIISFAQENEELLERLNKKIPLFRFPDQQNMFSTENVNFLLYTIKLFRPDVLINQESYSNLFGLLVLIKGQISCKIITVEHNSPNARIKMFVNYIKNEKLQFSPKSILKKLLHPILILKRYNLERKSHLFLYSNSDEYILLSEKFIPLFSKISGLKVTDKIKAIENPVTIQSQTIQLENKEKIVLYVGRLDHGQKRVDRLVKIWEKITPDVPDWKLLIVGEGADRIQLEKYITEHAITNINFEGAQSNVAKYYSLASILCLTSDVEGWPLVLAESMSFGCVPVLYDSFASATDIIENGINGILIRPFNEKMYENALSQLMKQKDKRELMAANAIDNSIRFSLNKVGRKWKELLEY